MTEIQVSVCIASYNQFDYISECIESVLDQETSFNYELVIGDDASCDGTQSIIQQFANKYPNIIKLISRKNNLGCPNNGLDIWKKAKGKYVALLDGDDYWTDPYKLQKQVVLLEENANCSFCFTDCDVLEDNIAGSRHPDFGKASNFTSIDFADQTGSIAQTCTWLIRTHLLRNLPHWVAESYTGDWCMQVHFAKFGPAIYLPASTAVYRIHDKGVWSRLNEFDAWRKNLEFYRVVSKEFNKRSDKKRISKRLENTIIDALELANINSNMSEISYWTKEKFKTLPLSHLRQSIHSIVMLWIFRKSKV